MNRNSFTLIEVLLALFITAILITILSVVFNTGLRSYRQGKDLLEIARKGQLIIGQMTRELTGAVVQKDWIPFFGKSDSIYFMSPVDDSGKIDLCEIGYLKDGDVLKRYSNSIEGTKKGEFPNVPVDYKKGGKNIFCEDVTAFNMKYSSSDGIWDDSWGTPYSLPNLVEVNVSIKGEYPKNVPKQERTFTTWIYLPNSTNNP